MPPSITQKPIVFDNNHEANAVFPTASATGQEIVEALEIGLPKCVLLIMSGG